MEDIRTAHERRLGWWLEERATIPCAVTKDGLLVKFRLKDVQGLMDNVYPHRTYKNGDKVWYFNSTRDREIAILDGDFVIANPHVLWDHYLKR